VETFDRSLSIVNVQLMTGAEKKGSDRNRSRDVAGAHLAESKNASDETRVYHYWNN
jgi:hypothetical protein